MKVTLGNIEVQPGQYWEINDTRYMVVGINPHDEEFPVVCTDEDGDIECFAGNDDSDDHVCDGDEPIFLPGVESFTDAKPDPGEGYTLLNNAYDTLQDGDEWLTLSCKSWVKCTPGSKDFSSCHFYRRKNPPTSEQRYREKLLKEQGPCPAGYRYLEEGETMESGDEYVSMSSTFSPIGPSVGKKYITEALDTSLVRRKLASPQRDPGDGWRLIDPAVDTPEEGDEFWNIYVSPQSWQQRSSSISDFAYGTIYRRRLPQAATPAQCLAKHMRDQLRNDKPVQPGYRYLEDGEVIEHGDEFYAGVTWRKCTDTVGTKYADESLHISIIRRKLPEPAAVNYPQYWTLPGKIMVTAYMVKYTADSPVVAITRSGESVEITKGNVLLWWIPATADEALERFRSMVHTTDEVPNCAAEVPSGPDPGEGYRLIDKAVDTPQENDELWDGKTWNKRSSYMASKPFSKHETDIYRRKLEPPQTPDPGPGYRLIDKAVDKPEVGDEYWHPGCKQWSKRCTDPYCCPYTNMDIYRRKLPQAPPVQYRTLEKGETVKDGDEVSVDKGIMWHKACVSVGYKVSNFCEAIARRPIRLTSDPQYRYLDDEEIIKEGDHIDFRDKQTVWLEAISLIGSCANWHPDIVVRRKVQQ